MTGQTVGKALEHVTNVYDEGSILWFGMQILSGFCILKLQAASAVLNEQCDCAKTRAN
jgi:hypothetical protein